MSNRNKRDQRTKLERKKFIYERDKGKCRIGLKEGNENGYCGGVDLTFEEATLDHIIPYSHRGPTTNENLQLACQSCNALKANNYSCPCGLPPGEQGCRKGIEKGWERYANMLELRMLYKEWLEGEAIMIKPHWELPLDELEEFRKNQ